MFTDNAEMLLAVALWLAIIAVVYVWPLAYWIKDGDTLFIILSALVPWFGFVTMILAYFGAI